MSSVVGVSLARPLFSTASFRKMSELQQQAHALKDDCPAATTSIEVCPAPTIATVRKKLFGPINPGENIRFVQEELLKISNDDSKKWNFDFRTCQPREGQYKWQEVKTSDIPIAYKMTELQGSTSNNNSRIITSVSSAPVLPSTSKNKRAITTVMVNTKARRNLNFSDSDEESPKKQNNNTSHLETKISKEEVTNKCNKLIKEDSISSTIITSKLQRIQDNNTKTTKQSEMTDFLRVRKRSLNATTSKSEEIESPAAKRVKVEHVTPGRDTK